MELYDILFKWLQTFELESTVENISDLTDGVVIAQALNQIAPEWFNSIWLAKIKPNSGANWRLKVSNLKKIIEKIFDYYLECFNQPLRDFKKPDAVKIGDSEDKNEIARLLQLVLGCAVNCENKQEYIRRIMGMHENEQRVMMECIQELDSDGVLSASLQVEPQVEQLIHQLAQANLELERMSQRCAELDGQVNVLQEEKKGLEEKKKLYDIMQSSIDNGSGILRRQMDALKEELFKAETSRDDYRMKVEIQDKKISELQLKVDDLQKCAVEARNLKDELDILRETADKVDKYEATLQSYKKKLEESGDVKRELKLLESKNLNYIQQNIELEEEVKKANMWKTQVEAYKKQICELHEKLNEETKRSDKLEYEVNIVQDKLDAALREKERLVLERNFLKEANEEMNCLQLQKTGSEGIALDSPIESVPEDLVISNAELRQKIIRLQHENNILKSQKTSDENADSLSVLQNLLDDANEQLEKLRKENREANQKLLVLEGEKNNNSASGGYRAKFIELQQQLARERQRHTAELEEKEAALIENKQVIALMQEKINQKELELQEAEDKQKRYIEKARSAVKAIDPTLNADQQLDILNNRLKEREKDIKQLEKAFEGIEKRKEIEDKLMATAFHNLAQMKLRKSAENRLSSLGSSGSVGAGTFLSRQRQINSHKVNNFNSK